MYSSRRLFRRSQRQRISPSPEPQPNQILSIDLPHSSQPHNTIDNKSNPILFTTSNNIANMTNQQKLHLSDNVNKNIKKNFFFLNFFFLVE